MRFLPVFASLLFIFSASASAAEMPSSFADLVEKLSPAVVNISTTQKVKSGQVTGALPQLPNTPEMEPFRDFFERFGQVPGGQVPDREVTSLGSGFVIDPSGYVITNNHVIDAAEEITVTFSDNSKYKAKIIGKDAKTDLALLKIEAKKPLPFVALGDSDKMRVGDWVIAIGNPFGLGGSVTQGIISARQRNINAGPYDDFLQTDAPINRGNSGGPLFNLQGEVIGINTAIFSPSGGSIGIGFAIPTVIAKPVIEQLKSGGRVHRGWLGVKIQEVSDEAAESVGLNKAMGALVIEVTPGGPAAKAGVQVGDIITQFDGKDISEMRFLPRMVGETKIGKNVSLTVWRKGKSISANATLAELDETVEANATEKSEGNAPLKETPKGEVVLGLRLNPVTPQVKQEFRLSVDHGLLIVEATQGSEAAKRGLKRGDVIEAVNNEPVKSVDELKQKVSEAKKAGRKFVLLKVAGAKDTAFVTLPVS